MTEHDTDDDSDFFIRPRKAATVASAPAPEKRKPVLRRRNRRALLLFGLGGIYGLTALIILGIQTLGYDGMSLLALYAYGILGGAGILLIRRFYSDADRSRKILTEVLEKSAEARIIIGPHGETIYSNARFHKLVHDEDASTLASFTALFESPAKAQKTLDELSHRAAPAGSATAEMPTMVKGHPAWFQVTCQHIIGWPGHVHWRFDDITPRYQLEAAIREEREKLRDFTDNAPVGFFSVDSDGVFRFANDTLLRWLGQDARQLIGHVKLHDILLTPPEQGRAYDCFEGGGDHQHGELILKGAGGRNFKAAITHSITHDDTGAAISRSIVHDLTSEQAMRQRLAESEDRSQRLYDEAPVGIAMLTAEGKITGANQMLAGMLALPAASINGKPLQNFVPGENKPRAESWVRQLMADGRPENFIEIPMKGSGTDLSVQIFARRLSADGGHVLHFIDITDRKNLERQFTQSQKMQAVGQLAGGIAHDFNNLLTAMIGFCDLLLLRHKPGDPSFSDIMQIKQNANRAANLVRQLLAFSRQQTLQPRVLDMTDVVSELSHLIRRLIGVNIDLELTHDSDVGLIRADQGQMEQVMINLVVNARDAMPGGGKLTVRTQSLHNHQGISLANDEILPPGEWVKMEVEDTGTGIAPDVLPRIFEPFFSTKEVGAGTGLGLATVHGIVHQTGGFIDVRSQLGRGTTFIVYLPRHKDNGEAVSSAASGVSDDKAAATDLTGSATILLVEDEDAVRTFSARALSNKGYRVMDAPGGNEALKLLEEKKVEPEILITDVMMPEMDGTTLAKQVREKYPQIKIIFISGYAEDKFKEHLGDAVWFLPKPFTLKQLAIKVKEVLGEEE